MTNRILYPLFGLALASFCGCGDGKKAEPATSEEAATAATAWAPSLENPQPCEIAVSETKKSVPEMNQDDIIVSVNGAILRRRDVDVKLKQKRWALSRDYRLKADAHKRNGIYKVFGERLVDTFVNTQLGVQEGRRQVGATEEEVRAFVDERLGLFADQQRLALADLDQQLPGGLDAVRRDLEDEFWFGRFAKSVTPPVTVDDDYVARIMKEIDDENAGIDATNAVKRAKLEEIRRKVVANEMPFGEAADAFSEDITLTKDGTGSWGVYTTEEVDQDPVLRAIITRPVGYVSEIVEYDQYYAFIKVLAVNPKTPDGDVQEGVELGRIVVERADHVELADREGLKASLEAQVKSIAIQERLKALRAEATIVYPYGQDFWGAEARKLERAKERELKKAEQQRAREERQQRRQAREAAAKAAAEKAAENAEPETVTQDGEEPTEEQK